MKRVIKLLMAVLYRQERIMAEFSTLYCHLSAAEYHREYKALDLGLIEDARRHNVAAKSAEDQAVSIRATSDEWKRNRVRWVKEVE